jgi:cation diffusion facilitator CzcD-associated flavoprotein CzcO
MDRYDAVVVGAGFGGMYALYRLRDLGFSVRVFDAAGDVGGTWWWNRYPGARCDIESLDYSYSFSPELEQEWEWTERYASQPEILRYANHVADRFGLRRDIQFETRVESATFDDESGRWDVSTDRGDEVSAQFLLMATGCLSTPKLPEVDGIDTFGGETYHTAIWPHEGVDLSGRRVAVIGTGSSGIQAIPLIAEQAAELTVFQRTPAYSTPAHNAPLDPQFVAARKASYQAYREEARTTRIGVVFDIADDSATAADPAERERRFRRGWDEGTLFGVASKFGDILIDPQANELASEFLRRQIRDIVVDPDVAERLSPRTFPYATKRPCLDTGYYETFNRPNVMLVDLRATPITEVNSGGILTTERQFDVDVIVFATGFDAITGPLLAVNPIGLGGLTLREKWSAGPRTYLGLAIAGFPNLFLITGPGSPSVLTNVFVSIEHHVDWIADLLIAMGERGVTRAAADREAEQGWVEHVNEVGDMTLYPRAASWYTGANVPGKPRVFMPYVGGFGLYRELCAGVAADGYKGFALT